MSVTGPIKVAVVGGGCAGMAAAFELTRPELEGRYEVTLYQLGWRLGGKGASGRGRSGRIEEHGLHIWMGYYENAFRLLRECYAELAANPGDFPAEDWREAFLAEDTIGLSALAGAAGWHNWSAVFPPRPGEPGDPMSGAELLSLPRYVARTLEMLRTLILSSDSRAGTPAPGAGLAAAGAEGDPQRMVGLISELVGGGFAATGAVLAEALAVLQAGLKMLPSPLANPLTDLADWIAHHLRRWIEARLIEQPYYQHLWEVMDLVVASMVGVFRGGLLFDPRGFDAIDDYDCREWLRLNGASEQALQSAFLRGLYDLCMAYEDGDPARPRLAAGTSLRAGLRMFFTYRGAIFWRMRAGMGDVVFAPFYEVLRRRGVKFEFFHRLTSVRLAPQEAGAGGRRPYVSALEFDVQAQIRDPDGFRPLIPVEGRPCWPAEPDYAQLVDGERLAAGGADFECHWDGRRVATRTLEVGRDFDFVALCVGLGALPHVAPEILARDPKWRRMTDQVKSIETQAFQVWLDRPLAELGWTGPHGIGSAFAKPFDTWCDMSQTLPAEAWASRPGAVLYFCGALHDAATPADYEDPAYPGRRRAAVKAAALAYLKTSARHLWPGACDRHGVFRWALLAGDGEAARGPAAFERQYWRANVSPTDRYVLALPGTSQFRLSPLDDTYDNLTVAGDWTESGLNLGCVESAVMSGRLAAHALGGGPPLEDIVGYDHP